MVAAAMWRRWAYLVAILTLTASAAVARPADELTFDYAALDDFELLPAHLERAAFTDPTQYRFRTLYDTDSTNPGLYFGPYRITEVASGSHIVLERNPTWWGRKPAFRRIVVWAV